MIYRVIYRTDKAIDLEKFKNDKTVLCVAAIRWEGYVYTYIETVSKDSPIYRNFSHDERMYEIFHYNPVSEPEDWIKERKNSKGSMRFIKLQPEKFSSYIFQHYRYQEELRGERIKYSSIFCYGNQLAMYEETPNVKYDPKVAGELNTNDTDKENWQEYMRKHFMPGDIWTLGEYIYSYYIENEVD